MFSIIYKPYKTQSYLLYEHTGLPKSKMVAFSHTWTPENERGKGTGKDCR